MRAARRCVAFTMLLGATLCACGQSERGSAGAASGGADGVAGAGAPGGGDGAGTHGGAGASPGAGGLGSGGVGMGAAGAGAAGASGDLGGVAGALYGAGGAGAAGTLGTAGAPTPPPLSITAPDGAAVCDPAVCVVAHDWDALETSVDTFDEFHLATSADTTYLTLETLDRQGHRRRFIALDDGGNVAVEQGLVPGMSAPLLNVDSEGAPHVLGYVEEPSGSTQRAPLEEQILSGTAWSGSTVVPALVTYGFEIDPAGRSLVEARTDTDEIVLAAREGATWSQTPLPAQGAGTLALDVGGRPVFYLADGTTLAIYDAARTTLFTRPVPEGTNSSVPGHVALAASQPKPIAAGSAELAFALLGEDGLHVLLAEGGGAEPVDVPIPGTAPPAVPCTTTATGSLNVGQTGAKCAPDCTFAGSGLAPSGGFSLARTADGALFLAYVIADYDSTYQYTWHTSPTNLICMYDGPSGGWSSTLHVVRIAPAGGSLTEALSASVGQSDGARIEPTSNSWAVAARAFGQRVVVGVAERPTSGLAGVRVTTFDAVP